MWPRCDGTLCGEVKSKSHGMLTVRIVESAILWLEHNWLHPGRFHHVNAPVQRLQPINLSRVYDAYVCKRLRRQ